MLPPFPGGTTPTSSKLPPFPGGNSVQPKATTPSPAKPTNNYQIAGIDLNIQRAGSNPLPETTQALKELGYTALHPIQSAGTPSKYGAFGTALNSIKEAGKNVIQKVKDLRATPSSDLAGQYGADLKLISATGGLLFSPISALFTAANEVPGLNVVSKLVSLPFTAIGEVSTKTSNAVVDALPISPQAKEKIKPGLAEVVTLASQIYFGKYVDPIAKVAELRKRFSPKDAEMIVKQAEELAVAKTDIPQPKAEVLPPFPKESVSEATKIAQERNALNPTIDTPQNKKLIQEAKQGGAAGIALPDGGIALIPENIFNNSTGDVFKLSPLEKVDWVTAHENAHHFLDRFVKDAPIEQFKGLKESYNKDSPNLKQEFYESIPNSYASFKLRPDYLKEKAPNLYEWFSKNSSEFSKSTLAKSLEPSATKVQPVVEGKVAKAAQDINTKIVKKGFDELPQEQQAQYSPITKADQIQKVSELLASDYEKAKNMAIGKEPITGDVNSQVIFNAVKNRALAEGDVATLRDLASSPIAQERSIAAQKLGAAGFDNGVTEGDPVKAIQDVVKSREKSATRKSKNVEQIKKKTVKDIKESIKKTAPTKETWTSFVESITC